VRGNASSLAERLGREASVDGLRKLIELRDEALLQRYSYGLYAAKLAMLPEPIQDIVVGIVLVAAIGLDTYVRRRSGR